jgi:exosome complex protein LRP1
LTELIAKEREKAAALASEKKRLADDSTAEAGSAQAGENPSKRPKRNGGKKKK